MTPLFNSILMVLISVLVHSSVYGEVSVYEYDRESGEYRRLLRGLISFAPSIGYGKEEEQKYLDDPSSLERAGDIGEATLKVFDTYRLVLRRDGWSKEKIDRFIANLEAEEKSLDPKQTEYHLFRDPETREIKGVLQIRHERDGDLKRVQFCRALSLPRPGETPILKELALSAAQNLRRRYGQKGFKIYARSDRVRTQRYIDEYNFAEVPEKSDPGNDDHYVEIDGVVFIWIYYNHIAYAYHIATNAEQAEKAFGVIKDHQEKFHLEDFAPSSHALEHLRMLKLIYEGKGVPFGQAAAQLTRGAKSDYNVDFEVIFLARAYYDLLTFEGDPERAARYIRRHIDRLTQHQFSPKRTWYLERLESLFLFHAGHSESFLRFRGEQDLDSLLAEQKAVSRRFFDAYAKLQSPDLSAINAEFVEPRQNPFLATNPFVFRYLAEHYFHLGQYGKSALLRRMADELLNEVPCESSFRDEPQLPKTGT